MPRQPRYSSHDALLDARPAVTLDLHGRTEAEGRAAVEKLVKSSGASGKVVHLITGKGKGYRRKMYRAARICLCPRPSVRLP